MFARSFALLVLLLGISFAARAQSIWDGGAGTSSWSDAGNWSSDALPGSGSAVEFDGSGAFSIALDGDRTVDAVSFSGGSGYTLSGNTLTISSGAISVASPASGSVTHTIASTVSLAAASTLDVGSSATLLLSGTVNSKSSVTKTGSGTVILSGTDAFNGSAVISEGTLQLGNGGTTGTIAAGILDNASLVFKYSTLTDFTGDIAGSGSVTQSGSSTVRLAGTCSFTGGLSVLSGNVAIGNGGTGGSLASDISNNGIVIFNRTTDYAYTGAISGGGSLYKVNSNTLTLSGSSSYTGTTHLEGGTLSFSALSNLGGGTAITFSGGALQWASGNTADISSRTVTIDSGGATIDTNGNNVTFASAVGNNGSGALTKTGSGTLTLSGTNTYSGGTTVSEGTVSFSSLGNLGDGGITLDGGALKWSSGVDITSRVVTIGSGGGTLNVTKDTTLAGAISGPGALTRSGSSTLTLGGASTYSGGTVLAGGVIAFTTLDNLGTGGITFNGGKLRWLGSADITERTVTIDSGGASFDTNGHDVTLAGSFSSSNALSKSGNGTLNITGTITVGNLSTSGPMKVSGGGTFTSTSKSLTPTVSGTTFTVDGAGTTWNTGNDLYLSSNAVLEITGGGTVVSTGSSAVSRTAGTATVNVSGSGSTWSLYQLQLGYAGSSTTTGVLNILSGGQVTSTYAQLGIGATGIGNVTVDDATWTNANYIEIGSNTGTGTLAVQNGGTVTTLQFKGSGAITLDDGTIALTSTHTMSNPITLSSGGGAIDVASGSSVTMAGVLSGTGGLAKTGGGTLLLSAANTFTGAIRISGGTLRVSSESTIGTSSGVTAASGGTLLYNDTATFGGSLANTGGTIGGTGNLSNFTLDGSGKIAPGDSGAGILEAGATDGSGGLGYEFEFTLRNALPAWSLSSASGNDILRLVDVAPFAAALGSNNTVAIYLDFTTINEGDVFTGGFYADQGGDFLASVSGATFQYYIADASGDVSLDGVTYALYSGPLTFSIVTVAQGANFSDGSGNGQVLQITAVPEPSAGSLLVFGALALALVIQAMRRKFRE
jgi:autotransporter-associated beta strand protein/T5SS/PEP-CTERM-associated repeat protein